MKQKLMLAGTALLVFALLFIFSENKTLIQNVIQAKTNNEQQLSTPQNAQQTQTTNQTASIQPNISPNEMVRCNGMAEMFTDPIIEDSFNWYSANQDIFFDNIKQQQTQQARIASAFINKNKSIEADIKMFDTLSQTYPSNKLIAFNLMLHCGYSTVEVCDETMMQRALDTDNQNGALWLQMAIYQLKSADVEKAKKSLVQFIHSQRYNEYSGDYLSTIDLALKEAGANDDLSLKIAMLGIAATRYKPNYSLLIKLCDKTDTDNASLLNICLQTSERLIESKGGLFTHQMGLSIQKSMLEKYGDSEGIANNSSAQKAFDTFNEEANIAMNMVLRSRKRTGDWLSLNIDYGELAALEYMIDQAKQASANHQQDQCAVDW
ncbi:MULTISPECIES: hypothetical protein [Pseudomonadati]|uniref:Sel1 repeat family protein n=1 Tax=Shewanella aestuarii TaxID=1028752 RepID=A0ABT0L4U3_9GAMM|nr:hypothetical protein [Shewanella aestuarii]MCL1118445.1 hypothetical protein [Shewanella aestuarii]